MAAPPLEHIRTIDENHGSRSFDLIRHIENFGPLACRTSAQRADSIIHNELHINSLYAFEHSFSFSLVAILEVVIQ